MSCFLVLMMMGKTSIWFIYEKYFVIVISINVLRISMKESFCSVSPPFMPPTFSIPFILQLKLKKMEPSILNFCNNISKRVQPKLRMNIKYVRKSIVSLICSVTFWSQGGLISPQAVEISYLQACRIHCHEKKMNGMGICQHHSTSIVKTYTSYNM